MELKIVLIFALFFISYTTCQLVDCDEGDLDGEWDCTYTDTDKKFQFTVDDDEFEILTEKRCTIDGSFSWDDDVLTLEELECDDNCDEDVDNCEEYGEIEWEDFEFSPGCVQFTGSLPDDDDEDDEDEEHFVCILVDELESSFGTPKTSIASNILNTTVYSCLIISITMVLFVVALINN
eukprot:TRINITY_DN23_c0_g1_i2.p1 TRINITY_DN23_c0_g1~~TRINITY_DN23_c0_g1_i2.p1  ORF type:complete len:179 (-),score=47.10 TRINITY_DN23_c0_g1_i2:172-708(-)